MKSRLSFLSNQAKKIPLLPGIYFFKNQNNKIIYIGKAKKLRIRVKSYFNNSNTNIKSQIMISKTFSLDYLVTNNEVEAIITEANMIKEYKPKYNVFLKDDKTFPYIIITNEPYPKVKIIRKKNLHKDGNIYFGPYTDVGYLRQVLKALYQIFPIKTCISDKPITNEGLNKSKKSCFCGFCTYDGLIEKEDYSKIIIQVIDFLRGKNKAIKSEIKSLMDSASEELQFEKAAKYRDKLIAIESFMKKQKKIARDFNSYDIIHTSSDDKHGLGLVMRVRNGLLIGREKFEFRAIDDSFDKTLNDFIVQYYNNTLDIPNQIVVNSRLENRKIILKWLSLKIEKDVSIVCPKIGNKRKMLDLCIKNTDMILKDILIKKIKRKNYISKTLQELKNILSMSVLPKRIEAFDNSNLNGTNPMSSMVCFLNGKPLKKEYRIFIIRTVNKIDDFKSMREVVFRRYSRQLKEKKKLPDLILIDGGKGQLSAAKESLDKLGLESLAVIGLAKKYEEIFIPSFSDPQNISKTSPALYLLRHIRDEAHRFAINAHRKKRNKHAIYSEFSKIKNIGPKKLSQLWKFFDSLEKIAGIDRKKLSKKLGVSISTANQIIEKAKLIQG